MNYRLVPLEAIQSDPEVHALCRAVGSGAIPQTAGQAAAWHLANGLTWRELAQLNRVESRYTGNQRFFTTQQLRRAQAWLAEQAERSESDRDTVTTSIASTNNVQDGLRE